MYCDSLVIARTLIGLALLGTIGSSHAVAILQDDTLVVGPYRLKQQTGWTTGEGKAAVSISTFDNHSLWYVVCDTTLDGMRQIVPNATVWVNLGDLKLYGNAYSSGSSGTASVTSYLSAYLVQPTNLSTATVYCGLTPEGESIERAEARGGIAGIVKLTIRYSSIPYPTVTASGPLDMGDVAPGQTVEKKVPVKMYYTGQSAGDTVRGKTTWTIAGDSGNPSNLTPEVLVDGMPATEMTTDLSNNETSVDDMTVRLTGNQYAGNYSWTMSLTTTVE